MACLLSGCPDPDSANNDRAVEKLRQQLLLNKYEDIYDGASSVTREQITQKEFEEKMKEAATILKDVDGQINWVRNKASPEPAVYREDNWSSLELEKNGRNINVQLDWSPVFHLCGMLISGDIPNAGVRIFRNCD